jgi:dihydrofolate synthase/folylpolyglutamate synthase
VLSSKKKQSRAYLDSFINYEKQSIPADARLFNLKRVECLLRLLDDPHKKIKSVHIAGTNGKGSVCAFVSSILLKSGYRVGLYTSPHLYDMSERIRVLEPLNLKMDDEFFGRITEDELSQRLDELKPFIDEFQNRTESDGSGQLTYFEILTVLAIQHFYQRRVDVAVVEVGMGGRLDATNILQGLVCAITPISLDHTRQLGEGITQIAGEKAAIIKSNQQSVVVAPQIKEAEDVIKARCQEFGITARFVDPEIFSYKINLLGRHQKVNAATAVAVTDELSLRGFVIQPEAIETGLLKSIWPGRFEIVQNHPVIVCDCAHNPSGCETLIQTTRDIYPGKHIILVLGMSADKDAETMCRQLKVIADEVILTKSRHARAADPHHLKLSEYFSGKHLTVTEDVSTAITLAQQKAGQNSVIVVAGSIFMIAEARELLCINTKV